MLTNRTQFKAQIGRYRHLAKKLKRLLKQGRFQLMSIAAQRKLLTKLQERLRQIGHLVLPLKLKGALAGIALLLGTDNGSALMAQDFAPAVTNPFGIGGPTEGYQSFADLDGDSDLDLLLNGYNMDTEAGQFVFLENTGTPTAPEFSADNYLINPFGIETGALSQPIFRDFDDDGDLDLISGNLYAGGFQYQKNIGTPTAPEYTTSETNPFGLSSSGVLDFATAADLDGDGDIDILAGGFSGSFNFFENTGTVSTPAFAQPQANPFGIAPIGYISIPNLGDLDNDGDYDLLFMSYESGNISMRFQENTGSASNPVFGTDMPAPAKINSQGLNIPIPANGDIDGDGDMDVFLSDNYGGAVNFYENLNINVEIAPTAADNTVTMVEDGIYFFNQIDFNFADENASDVLSAVQITSLPSNGLLKLGSTLVTANQIVQVDVLQNLIFDSDTDENGSGYANLNFKVYDGGLWSVDEYMMTINVTPVNDLPVSTATTIDAAKNTPFFFEAADFPFTDVDGDVFAGLKILSLPAKGNLKLGGNNVTVGQNITAANIPNLTYTPLPNEFGANYSSFNFQVSDGTALSAQQAMTINVEEPSSSISKALQAKLSIAPNPAEDELNLRIESVELLGQIRLLIFDETGRKILAKTIDGNSQVLDCQLNISNFSSGNYIIRFEGNGMEYIARFVKS